MDANLHGHLSTFVGAFSLLPPRKDGDGFNLLDMVEIMGTRQRASPFKVLESVGNNLKDFLDDVDRRLVEDAELPDFTQFESNEGRTSYFSMAWSSHLAGSLGIAPGAFGVHGGFANFGGWFRRSQQMRVKFVLKNMTLRQLSSAREHYGGTLVERLIYKYLQDGILLSNRFRLIFRQAENPHFVFGVVRSAYLGRLFVRESHRGETDVGGNGDVPVPLGGPATVTISGQAGHVATQSGAAQVTGRGTVGVKLSCFVVKTTQSETNPGEKEVRISRPIEVISGDEAILAEARREARRRNSVVRGVLRRWRCRNDPFTGVLLLILSSDSTWRFEWSDCRIVGEIQYPSSTEVSQSNSLSNGSYRADPVQDDDFFEDAVQDVREPSNSSTVARTQPEKVRFIREKDLFAPLQNRQEKHVDGWSVIDTVIVIEPGSHDSSIEVPNAKPVQRTSSFGCHSELWSMIFTFVSPFRVILLSLVLFQAASWPAYHLMIVLSLLFEIYFYLPFNEGSNPESPTSIQKQETVIKRICIVSDPALLHHEKMNAVLEWNALKIESPRRSEEAGLSSMEPSDDLANDSPTEAVSGASSNAWHIFRCLQLQRKRLLMIAMSLFLVFVCHWFTI